MAAEDVDFWQGNSVQVPDMTLLQALTVRSILDTLQKRFEVQSPFIAFHGVWSVWSLGTSV
eukprot:gene29982-37430_t